MSHLGCSVKLRPFFSYYGSKWRSSASLPRPKYNLVVEPFAGSAGYATRHHDRDVLLIDNDENIIRAWNVLLRKDVDESVFPETLAVDRLDSLGLDEDCYALAGFWINKASVTPKNVYTTYAKQSKSYETFRSRFYKDRWHVQHWEVFSGSYRDAPDVEATWFIDPPYKGAGRFYTMGCDKIDYDDLAEFCLSRRGQVIVLGGNDCDWLPFNYGRWSLGTASRKSVERVFYRET